MIIFFVGRLNSYEKIEMKVGKKSSRVEKKKWDCKLSFHSLLYRMLAINAAQISAETQESLVGSCPLPISPISSFSSPLKMDDGRMLHEIDISMGDLLVEMHQYYKEGPNSFRDLVFGTTCRWGITVCHDGTSFRALLFCYRGKEYLLIFDQVSDQRRTPRKRSSAMSDGSHHFREAIFGSCPRSVSRSRRRSSSPGSSRSSGYDSMTTVSSVSLTDDASSTCSDNVSSYWLNIESEDEEAIDEPSS